VNCGAYCLIGVVSSKNAFSFYVLGGIFCTPGVLRMMMLVGFGQISGALGNSGNANFGGMR
jgi:hypothetical protein